MDNRFRETNCVEFKRSWRDEWLKWICVFANSDGRVLSIGIDEKKAGIRNELIAGALYGGIDIMRRKAA